MERVKRNVCAFEIQCGCDSTSCEFYNDVTSVLSYFRWNRLKFRGLRGIFKGFGTKHLQIQKHELSVV